MRKYLSLLIINLFFLSFLFPNFVFAQKAEKVGILPTSSFYFLKEWGRGVRMIFTFNPISKAELQLKFSDEKIKELREIVEKDPQNEKVIKKALSNYQKSREKLAKRLASLKGTSQNPKIDSLLNKVVEQDIRHIELLDGINKTKIKGLTIDISPDSELITNKDNPEKFAERVKSGIERLPERELKPLRAVEIIDRLSENLKPELAGPLINIREEYSEKLVEELGKAIESGGGEVKPQMIETIKSLPGDSIKHLMILEEIENKIKTKELIPKTGELVPPPYTVSIVTSIPSLRVIQQLKEGVTKPFFSEEDMKKEVGKQIEKVQERINKLEKALKEFKGGYPKEKVEVVLNQAKEYLRETRRFFEDGKYKEAFDLALFTNNLVEDGLRALLSSKTPTPVEPPSRQACPLIAPACPLENCLKAGRELEKTYTGCDYTSACEKQCQIEECGPMPLYPTREGCERVCKDGRWQDICQREIRE
jgi:hypothetical protein